ncbi:caspase domain-containing protein [Daldinia sp. FL1419]|nr:caspase domain-containing protein [Daldinia sp. FL1419]
MMEEVKAASRWAVLIGVDHYGQEEGNLGGCANDAVLVYNFMTEHLGILPHHIFLHIARNESSDPLGLDHEQLEATPSAVKVSLEEVLKQTKGSEAFLHVHFSGHGDTQQTIFRKDDDSAQKRSKLKWFPGLDLSETPSPTGGQSTFQVTEKSKGAKDELLCFPNGKFITDVEFGKMLTEIAGEGLIVSVTVDCCFSGGAIRGDQFKTIRCRSLEDPDVSLRGHESEEMLTNREYRKGIRRDSYLYREQQSYNAMMACQAHQFAAEGISKDRHPRRRYGAFTSTFISRLEDLADNRKYITYGEFQGILGAIATDKSWGGQIPAYFGPTNRVLFERVLGVDSKDLAYVKMVKTGNRFVIDKGTVAGAEVGDKFGLTESSLEKRETIDKAFHVKLTQVNDFESEFEFLNKSGCPKDLNSFLRTKRVAQLIEPASIPVLMADDGSQEAEEAIRDIKSKWEKVKKENVAPFRLFSAGDHNATELQIHVSNEYLEIRDDKGNPFERLPKITITGDRMIKRLMLGLKGMSNFQTVSRMKTPSKSNRGEKPFRLEIEPIDPPEDQGNNLIAASHQTRFTNTGKGPLYITILNLNPGYGIERVYPDGDYSYGKYIGAGETVDGNSLIFDTVVPAELVNQYQSDGIIHDIRKVIVTTQPVNLRGLEQSDVLGDDDCDQHKRADNSKLNFRPVTKRDESIQASIKGWWIEDYPINPTTNDWIPRPRIRIPPVR